MAQDKHHHVCQVVHGTRNVWRQGQYWIKRGVDDKENVDCVRQSFALSPSKSMCTAARQLQLSHSAGAQAQATDGAHIEVY